MFVLGLLMAFTIIPISLESFQPNNQQGQEITLDGGTDIFVVSAVSAVEVLAIGETQAPKVIDSQGNDIFSATDQVGKYFIAETQITAGTYQVASGGFMIRLRSASPMTVDSTTQKSVQGLNMFMIGTVILYLVLVVIMYFYLATRKNQLHLEASHE